MTYRRRTWWFSSSSTSRGPDGATPTTWTGGSDSYMPGRRVCCCSLSRARSTHLAWQFVCDDFDYHERHENTNIRCVRPHEYHKLCRDDRRLAGRNEWRCCQYGLPRMPRGEPRLTDGNAAAAIGRPPPLFSIPPRCPLGRHCASRGIRFRCTE